MDQQVVLDRKRLIGRVAERHRIRIDEEDPAFYVLSLNEFALEEATKGIVEQIGKAGDDFYNSVEKAQQRAGQFLAQQMKESCAILKQEIDRSDSRGAKEPAAAQVVSIKPAAEWITVGILAALLMFACGILVGIALKW